MIIAREIWDTVQAKLRENAAPAKRRETAASPFPLAGKFVDEIGDRLTPSHATRGGRRHRYDISHRLIARSGEADLGGWRLPATTLETAVATLIRTSLTSPAGLAKLMKEPTPADIAAARSAVADLLDKIDGPSRPKLVELFVTDLDCPPRSPCGCRINSPAAIFHEREVSSCGI